MNKSATHVLHVGGRKGHLRINLKPDRIEGALDLPKRLRREKYQKAVQTWLDGVCEPYAADERAFHMIVTQGRRVRALCAEKGGIVAVVYP